MAIPYLKYRETKNTNTKDTVGVGVVFLPKVQPSNKPETQQEREERERRDRERKERERKRQEESARKRDEERRRQQTQAFLRTLGRGGIRADDPYGLPKAVGEKTEPFAKPPQPWGAYHRSATLA